MCRADLRPVASVLANQLAINEKMICLHGQQFWLYGAVDPHTNEIVTLSFFPTTNRITTRWFLDDLHQQCWLRDVTILVDGADYFIEVLAEDGYGYEHVPHDNRNAVERVFWKVECRTSCLLITLAMSHSRQQSRGPSLRRLLRGSSGSTLP